MNNIICKYCNGTKIWISPIIGNEYPCNECPEETVIQAKEEYKDIGKIRDIISFGSPEGKFVGAIGSIYKRLDDNNESYFYVKESGIGNTGWVGR